MISKHLISKMKITFWLAGEPSILNEYLKRQ